MEHTSIIKCGIWITYLVDKHILVPFAKEPTQLPLATIPSGVNPAILCYYDCMIDSQTYIQNRVFVLAKQGRNRGGLIFTVRQHQSIVNIATKCP